MLLVHGQNGVEKIPHPKHSNLYKAWYKQLSTHWTTYITMLLADYCCVIGPFTLLMQITWLPLQFDTLFFIFTSANIVVLCLIYDDYNKINFCWQTSCWHQFFCVVKTTVRVFVRLYGPNKNGVVQQKTRLCSFVETWHNKRGVITPGAIQVCYRCYEEGLSAFSASARFE